MLKSLPFKKVSKQTSFPSLPPPNFSSVLFLFSPAVSVGLGITLGVRKSGSQTPWKNFVSCVPASSLYHYSSHAELGLSFATSPPVPFPRLAVTPAGTKSQSFINIWCWCSPSHGFLTSWFSSYHTLFLIHLLLLHLCPQVCLCLFCSPVSFYLSYIILCPCSAFQKGGPFLLCWWAPPCCWLSSPCLQPSLSQVPDVLTTHLHVLFHSHLRLSNIDQYCATLSTVIIHEDCGSQVAQGWIPALFLPCSLTTVSDQQHKNETMKPNYQGSNLRSVHLSWLTRLKPLSYFLIIPYLISSPATLLGMKICEGRDHNVLFTIIFPRSSIVSLT